MSFSGNLLSKSAYKPRYISLVPSKEQESQISSQQNQVQISHNHPNHQRNLQEHTNNSFIPITNNYSKVNRFDNLLSMPSMDYAQKSAIFLQKRIVEKITKNHEKQLYYGKRRNQVIEISDVSSEGSEDESESKVERRNTNLQNQDLEEDQLLRRYGVEFNGSEREKKQQSKRHTRSNVRNDDKTNKPLATKNIHSNNPYQQQEQKPQQQHNPLAHLNPDFDQEKQPYSNNDSQSEQISEIGSDKSIIIIRRKKKSIRKRLRKHVNISNKVKIENKENSGDTHDCPICLTDLNKKVQKKKGKLPCNHMFCLKCITESSKFSNRCPYCRATYNQILSNGKRIEVEDTRVNEQQFEDPDDEPCYICGRNDDFEHLLQCEFCEYAYCHTYCDPRLNNSTEPPEEVWHCASCEELLRQRNENGEGDQEGDEMIQEEGQYEQGEGSEYD